MTAIHTHQDVTVESATVPPVAPRPRTASFVDLSQVASETPAESIAHENEIVEHIAHEHDFPEQPSEHSIDEQLSGLVDPEVIRSH